MADKGKAVAGNNDPRKRQRRARKEEALEDTANSGRTATAGGNGTLQELPRVTAATTPAAGLPSGASSHFGGALDHGGVSGTGNGGFFQLKPMLQPPVGNPNAYRGDNGPPLLHTLAKPAPPPERQSSSRAREQQLQAMRLQVANILNNPSSAVRSGPANPVPVLQPPVGNPSDNGPPQLAQIGNGGAPPGAESVRGRAIMERARAQREALLRQYGRPIICNACGHPSGTNSNACRVCWQSSSPGCYSNLLTGNAGVRPQAQGHGSTAFDQQRQLGLLRGQPSSSQVTARGGGSAPVTMLQQPVGSRWAYPDDNGPPQHARIGNAGGPQAQSHGSTAFDQQRQLGLLRGQPSSSQARAPGCSSCGRAPATRVALKMPMCEACFRDTFMNNAPPQHAQIGSMLPSPVPSYGGAVSSNYAQTGNVRPEHALAGNVSQSPVPTPSNAGAPQGQQQFRDSLAATEPSPAGSQRGPYSRCEACRLSGDKACMFCHNPGPPPPPAGQS